MRGANPTQNILWTKARQPALLSFLLAFLLIGGHLLAAGGDPLVFARLGTRFSQADPNGSEGYDGQFNYYIARDPQPQNVAPMLDVPAYRYQRILYPLLARLLALGKPEWIPWSMLLVGLVSIPLTTLAVARLLAGWGVNPWYALVVGLWSGLLLSLLSDLAEPLAFCLVAWGLLAREQGKYRLAWGLFALAVFAKEVTLVFVFALLLDYLFRRDLRSVFALTAVALLPFGLFQLWLWLQFGSPGIGSGGAMATSFEWLPFMGFWRIADSGAQVFLAFLVVFAPSILLPTVLGLWAVLRAWLKGERNVLVLALAVNCLTILTLPFSTFREPGGLLRFATGLVLMVILFSAHYKMRRVLNYSILWMVLNMFLIKV